MENELMAAKKEYIKALVAVQSKLKPAKKDKENPFYKSSYATLVSVHESCSKELTDNGFAVTQGGVHDQGKNYLRTVLHHEGGYSEAYDFPLIEDLSNPQKMGSAVTYARRYALAAIVGVIVDEDDDGQAASSPVKSEKSGSAIAARKLSDEKLQTTPNVREVFKPASIQKSSIMVKVVKAKETAKGTTMYSVLDDTGVWYSCFDEVAANSLIEAKDNKTHIDIVWTQKGDFKTIGGAAFPGQEIPKEVQEIPF